MIRIKSIIKKALIIIFSKRPIRTSANIVQLAPNELLKGRCALITGGTSGIGFSIAKAFLEAGAQVVITGRNEDRIQSSLASLGHQGKTFGFVMDNAEVSSFESIFERMKAAVGGDCPKTLI